MKEYVKDRYGKILGSIETKGNGELVARDYYGKILGYYYPSTNTTKDYYGRTITKGNSVVGLIMGNQR